MRVKKIAVVLRKDGFFHHDGRLIKAIYPNEGYGVMVFLESSPIDKYFEAHVWVPAAQELQLILEALNESDELTHELLGHGWASGPRPFQKLEDFM
jgi:hypothetical protein